MRASKTTAWVDRGQAGTAAKLAGFVLLAVLVSGCSGGSTLGTPSTSAPATPGWSERITHFFDTGGSPKPQQPVGSPRLVEDIDCPPVTVREGASTYRINASGQTSAMTVRYQGSIARTARDCHVAGSSVVMKVGVEGRIILGPAGEPGSVEVPLRFAVVREGPTPETITTKTYRVPVAIPPGTGNVPFVQIDDQLTFPLVPRGQLDNYVVYVGFDPTILKPQRPVRPKRKR